MIIAIDFDGTLIEHQVYSDVTTRPRLKPGAREALAALKRAGHLLVLWSGRANPSLMYLAEFDPLVRSGAVGDAATSETRHLHADRYRQMVDFVNAELPGMFDAIDDGRCGKLEADLYIDDRALTFGGGRGATWASVTALYGE